MIIKLTGALTEDPKDDLELGPFDAIGYEDGWFIGDGEKVAEVFAETTTDMMNFVTGHPCAGMVFAPRTFSAGEEDQPGYPGMGYSKIEVLP